MFQLEEDRKDYICRKSSKSSHSFIPSYSLPYVPSVNEFVLDIYLSIVFGVLCIMHLMRSFVLDVIMPSKILIPPHKTFSQFAVFLFEEKYRNYTFSSCSNTDSFRAKDFYQSTSNWTQICNERRYGPLKQTTVLI